MNNIDLKKLIIPNIPYLLFVWLFDKAAQAFRLSPGADLSEKLLALGTGFSAAFSNAAPSLHPMDLLIGIAGAVLIRLIVYFKGKNAKKYRKGMEYGSARWRNELMVIKSNNDHDERGLLPYPVIVAATKGDPDAMKIVLNRYEGDMVALSVRKMRDERGNTYYGVDQDIYDRLRARLIRVVLDFKV